MSLAKALQAAAGNAGEAVYIDDAFSTYLYTGNGSTQTITNGIDLAGEGGLVWTKTRSAAFWHWLTDTERGNTHNLFSNDTAAQNTVANGITSFNSNGFSVSDASNINAASQTYASWTFRKAENFFDVVTWTGNGVNGRAISHSLGSTPGTIIVKCTSAAEQWFVWHRSLNTQIGVLNLTDAFGTYVQGYQAAEVFGNGSSVVQPTSTNFTVAQYGATNQSGRTYVAYLFAHDAGGFGADGSENVISCGSFTTDGSGNFSVNLGYEPQFIMYKAVTAGAWLMFDTMRGLSLAAGGDAYLQAQSSAAEATSSVLSPTATGFQNDSGGFSPGYTYIYIAIRRPMKPPSAGTEVYQAGFRYSAISQAQNPKLMFYSGFPVDATIYANRGGFGGVTRSRLIGQGNFLQTVNANAEVASATDWFGSNLGLYPNGIGAEDTTILSWMFKRAPGFFDVVCYTGTGVARTVAHNLTVAPELIIAKNRSGASHWPVYAQSQTATKNGYLSLNAAFAVTGANPFNGTAPTSSVFTVGSDSEINGSGATYVAYLFATLPGVSKVGSYTGTGTTQQINCGFTSGARFVLIKATSTTGNWIVADSARGINGSTDPALYLNSTAAEVTGFDWIDADSSGFIVNETATIAANTNGVSYIFLAVS